MSGTNKRRHTGRQYTMTIEVCKGNDRGVVDPRAIAKARDYSIKEGDIVGHDSTDISGEVLYILDSIATVDFGPGGIRKFPVDELVDVNLVRHFAGVMKLGRAVKHPQVGPFRRRLRAGACRWPQAFGQRSPGRAATSAPRASDAFKTRTCAAEYTAGTSTVRKPSTWWFGPTFVAMFRTHI